MFQPPNYYPSLRNDLWFPCQALAWKHAGPPNDKHTHCVINDRRFADDKLANPRKARRASPGGSAPIITACLGATELHRKRLLCKAPISTVPFHCYSLTLPWSLSLFSNLPVPHDLTAFTESPQVVFPSKQSIGADYNDKCSGERHQLAMLGWIYEKKKRKWRLNACFSFSIKLKYRIIKLRPGSGESPWRAEDIDRPATDLCFVSQSKHVRTLFALVRGRRCGAPSM